jgi:hypothetical protein
VRATARRLERARFRAVPAIAVAVAAKPSPLAAEHCRRGQRQGAKRLIGEETLDLGRALCLEDGGAEILADAVELAVEVAVGEMGGALMKPRDDIQEDGADHDPGPVGNGEMFLHVFDLVMQNSAGMLKVRPRMVTRRSGIETLTTPADGLEHEQAKHAVDKIEQADQVVGRGEITKLVSKTVVVCERSAMVNAGSLIRQPHSTQRSR